jgi:hypothetical protein
MLEAGEYEDATRARHSKNEMGAVSNFFSRG